MKKLNIVLAAFLGLAALSTQAYAASNVTNAEVLTKKYTGIAQTVNPEFVPSVSEGKTFYNRKFTLKDGKQAACASCHTSNPADAGKHIVTGKAIAPLAPAVNKKRFRSLDKVEDKFTEHCNDILGADCTAGEKANYIVYLLTERTPTAKK
ncbi:MAG TPA: DUF1924 domain-containing protein [Methylotenera sp.]|jgi:hypothetical protein|nr:DUF1924 domain-containing protein [Methylotenera sp.]HQM86883.1 DUF1924 domain-containing protein [Methylotenera sp.]